MIYQKQIQDLKEAVQRFDESGITHIGTQKMEEIIHTLEALWRVARAAKTLCDQFEEIRRDQHEKLVQGQTFESASKNWSNLKQAPLEFSDLMLALSCLPKEAK